MLAVPQERYLMTKCKGTITANQKPHIATFKTFQEALGFITGILKLVAKPGG
jgi:hypothetical protein